MTIGGTIGALIGASIGLATGGWGMPATVPLGIAAGSLLGGTGYVVGDKLLDRIKCPQCSETIDLGV